MDLLPGQANFPQQQPRLDPFLFSTPTCEPSDDSRALGMCRDIAAEIAHAQQSLFIPDSDFAEDLEQQSVARSSKFQAMSCLYTLVVVLQLA